MTKGRERFALVIALTCALLIIAARPVDDDAAARRGKLIYLRGEGSSPIVALVGDENVEVPGSILPCSNCHGFDGRGKVEGGVRPSNITADALTRPYEVSQSGRKHPPYTRSALKRAVAMGTDPAGNKLQTAMPRYRISASDMNDLLAYLQRLGKERDPGLSETSIRIGVAVPSDARGALVTKILTSYFARVSANGGIYGRAIEGAFIPLRDAKSLEAFVDEQQPFALIVSSTLGADDELAAVIDAQQIPTITALSHHPSRNRYDFRLLGGLREQSLALAKYAIETLHAKPVIVYSESFAELANEVAKERELVATPIAATLPDAPLIVLAPDQLQELIGRAKSQLLVPGSAGGDVAMADSHVLTALPAWPTDQKAPAVEELRSYAGGDSVSSAVPAATLAAAKIVVEALRRAGRDVGREKLIDTLEGVYRAETGLTPPITFGPTRRVGSAGAHVLAGTEEARWVE